MSRRKKLTDEDCKKIAKLIDQEHQIKDLPNKYKRKSYISGKPLELLKQLL